MGAGQAEKGLSLAGCQGAVAPEVSEWLRLSKNPALTVIDTQRAQGIVLFPAFDALDQDLRAGFGGEIDQRCHGGALRQALVDATGQGPVDLEQIGADLSKASITV